MTAMPLTLKNLAKGMEKLKTHVGVSGCLQHCPGSPLQSFPFPTPDLSDLGCLPKGHLQPSDKMPKSSLLFPGKVSEVSTFWKESITEAPESGAVGGQL